MANLTSLPEEVFEKHIIARLGVNDTLRMRRVCKELKEIVDRLIKPDLLGEAEVNGKNKDVSSFMEMGLLPIKLFVDNKNGPKFYDDIEEEVLESFRVNVAPRVTHLRVSEVSIYPCFKEWTFLSGFVNLRRFEAGHYGNGGAVDLNLSKARADTRINITGTMLPDAWVRSLEELEIGHNKNQLINFDMQHRYLSILETFVNLTHVALPYLSFDPDSSTGFKPTSSQIMSSEKFHVQFLAMGVLAAKRKLKVIDFRGIHEESCRGLDLLNRLASDSVFRLFQTCLRSETKIKNAHPEWFMFHDSQHELFDINHGSVVLSMVNIHECVCNLDVPMPFLEELDIRETGRCCVDPFFDVMRPEWPNLWKIKIHVNSVKSIEKNQSTEILYNFFWNDADWDSVTDLSLSFERDMELLVPSTVDISASMPNIRRLELVNWIGSDLDLQTLWTDLQFLQDLTLDSCLGITNDALMHLRGVTRLTLKELDLMPGITDYLFINVIANLGLTHFYISSSTPLIEVTGNGIKGLKNGKFSETIQKFPFEDWSISGMKEAEFLLLERGFRSFNMV